MVLAAAGRNLDANIAGEMAGDVKSTCNCFYAAAMFCLNTRKNWS